MNRQGLIKSVSEKTGFTQEDCGMILDGFLATITETLQRGEKVQVIGFGLFEVKHRPSRMGRIPQVEQAIPIPERVVPVFRAGKHLRESVAPKKD